MLDDLSTPLDQQLLDQLGAELHQLEVETFEIEDLADLEQHATVLCSSCSSCSSSSCCSTSATK